MECPRCLDEIKTESDFKNHYNCPSCRYAFDRNYKMYFRLPLSDSQVKEGLEILKLADKARHAKTDGAHNAR